MYTATTGKCIIQQAGLQEATDGDNAESRYAWSMTSAKVDAWMHWLRSFLGQSVTRRKKYSKKQDEAK